MEQVLSKLSEIETTARRIMQEADSEKKVLSEEMEAKCKAFDQQIDAQTAEQVSAIRKKLETEKDARLQTLRRQTELEFSSMDTYYQENHQRLSQDIFQKLLEL